MHRTALSLSFRPRICQVSILGLASAAADKCCLELLLVQILYTASNACPNVELIALSKIPEKCGGCKCQSTNGLALHRQSDAPIHSWLHVRRYAPLARYYLYNEGGDVKNVLNASLGIDVDRQLSALTSFDISSVAGNLVLRC